MTVRYLPNLRRRGVKVRLVDGALKLGPADKLTPKMLEVCREHKAAIIAELQAELQQAPGGRSRVTADGRALKKHRPQLNDVQRTIGGRLQWCYQGIGLRTKREDNEVTI